MVRKWSEISVINTPGLMECEMTFVAIWSIVIDEEFVTLVGTVTIGIAPKLSR